jgi:CheY-like chemotaxis protein
MSVGCEDVATTIRDNGGRLSRPRLLLGYSDSAHAARCVRHFRRLGWEVHMVASGAEAQRLAYEIVPHLIVLDVDLPDETGWLSAAKILLLQPAHRVVLLAADVAPHFQERAESLGVAAVVWREDGPEALASLIYAGSFSVAV